MNLPKISVLIILSYVLLACNENRINKQKDIITVFEKTAGLETATYPEVIEFLQATS